jgi:FtsZ-binding cell division protein ZapB
VRDLKFEMQQKDESIGMKVDTIRNLQDTIESLKKHSNIDMEKVRRDFTELKEQVNMKDNQIQDLLHKCNEMMKA